MTPDELTASLAERAKQVTGIMGEQGGNPDATSGAAPAAEAFPNAPRAPRFEDQEGAATAGVDDAALAARQDEVRQEMKARGMAHPDEDISAINNFVRGGNNLIAKTIGLAPGAVNQALRTVGANFMEDDHSVEHAVKTFMDTLGVRTDARPGISAQLGEGTMESLIMAGGSIAAGTIMAARLGVSTSDAIIRQFGKVLKENPGKQALLTLPITTGAVAADNATPDAGPVGKILATTAGGLAGGLGGAGLLAAGAKTGGALLRGAGRAIGGTAPIEGQPVSGYRQTVGDMAGIKPQPPLQTEPVYNPDTARSTYPNIYADEQVRGAQLHIENAIDQAIAGIPTQTTRRGTPVSGVEAQTKVRDNLDEAFRVARGIESDFWSHTPLRAKVPSGQLANETKALEDKLKGTQAEAFIPQREMDEIYSLNAVKRDEAGKIVSSLPTVQRLRSIASDLGEQIAREPDQVNLNRNRAQLQDVIHAAIERTLPDNIPIQQARAVSTKVNELFTRGPIADVRAVRNRDPNVPPGQTVDYLNKQFGGIDSVLNISRDLGRVPRRFQQPDAYPYATGSAEFRRSGLPNELVANTENAIRTSVKEEAQNMGPEAAVKFINRQEPHIKALAGVTTELRQTADYLAAHMDNRNIIQKSALARFAQAGDADKAIQPIWNSPNPVKAARELMRTFGNDSEALDGFRHAMLKRLFDSTRSGPHVLDPSKVRTFLDTPRFSNLLQTVLAPDQFSRLSRLVDVARAIQTGETKTTMGQFIKKRMTVLASFAGAYFGRRLETGTLQAPAYFSKSWGSAMEGFLKTADPGKLLANAVTDPRWERILMSRAPTTTKDIRALNTNMRRLMSGMIGARVGIESIAHGKDDNNE